MTFQLEMAYFNEALTVWEPVLEPVEDDTQSSPESDISNINELPSKTKYCLANKCKAEDKRIASDCRRTMYFNDFKTFELIGAVNDEETEKRAERK